ncbi:MAG: hypothetical protein E7574_04915 [Ruminococcaceae bacterium]|nr:hypothetical protein [Oscillospiraceae bacterium]
MKKRKRRFGDRADGYLLKNISPMLKLTPFIMRYRSDSLNMFTSSVEISAAEKYIKQKHAEGHEHFGLVHLIIAAYVRTVSQRPAINRFVSGQQIFSRKNIEVAITIKKEMTLESPDTCIKMIFEPDATPMDVYNQFNNAVVEYRKQQQESDFDKTARILNYIPRFVLKFAMFLLRTLDYFGLLPKFLLKVSPFHASLVITSMGSLGIPPVFHHIYDFGNVPLFVAFGKRRKVYELNSEGNAEEKHYTDLCVVTDERICDGYYYASAFKMMQRLMRNPYKMDTPPEEIIEDID